jgi:hypothetical protein
VLYVDLLGELEFLEFAEEKQIGEEEEMQIGTTFAIQGHVRITLSYEATMWLYQFQFVGQLATQSLCHLQDLVRLCDFVLCVCVCVFF